MAAAGGNAESLERLSTAKHLYRTCVSCVKVLDQSTKQRGQLDKLFSPEVIAARVRLRETAEKLIFLNPTEFGKKAEDLIWKKCFYEPLQLFRSNISRVGTKERSWLSLLLQSASGHYHSYLLKLQVHFPSYTQFQLLDFPFTPTILSALNDSLDNGQNPWITESTYRSLIYLGDIGRYQAESGDSSSKVAAHFYHRALDLNPNNGMAHNQLGTLYRTQKPIQAAYHYMRCIMSRESYNGAVGNLTQLLKRTEGISDQDSSSESVTTARPNESFLAVAAELLDENNNLDPTRCRAIRKKATTALTHLMGGKMEEGNDEPNDIWVLICLIIMTIEYLEQNGSKNASVASDIFLSLVNVVLESLSGESFESSSGVAEEEVSENVTTVEEEERKEEVVKDEPPEPPKKPMSKLATLLGRRRRGSNDSSDEEDDKEEEDDESDRLSFHDGDLGEDDVIELEDSEPEVEKGDESTPPEISATPSALSQDKDSSITDGDNLQNGVSMEKSASWEDFLEEPLMAVIKTSMEYLASKPALLNNAAIEGNLISNIASILNGLPQSVDDLLSVTGRDADILRDEAGCKEGEGISQMKPLPEDRLLRGCPVFQSAFSNLDFAAGRLSNTVEDVLRLLFLKSLGLKLASCPDSGLKYTKDTGIFEACETADATEQSEETRQKERQESMMKNMARLRLNNELAELKRIGWIPVYLVPEAEAIISKLPTLKILVAAKKFVTVVPDSVIHELDRQKKDSSNAREAIRWLEHAFHQGTKFLRPQKKTERKNVAMEEVFKTMDVIGVDKKKEFKGIVECSAYLGGTVAHGTTVVTILTMKGYASELARLINRITQEESITGVSTENVHGFLSRWQRHQRKGKKSG